MKERLRKNDYVSFKQAPDRNGYYYAINIWRHEQKVDTEIFDNELKMTKGNYSAYDRETSGDQRYYKHVNNQYVNQVNSNIRGNRINNNNNNTYINNNYRTNRGCRSRRRNRNRNRNFTNRGRGSNLDEYYGSSSRRDAINNLSNELKKGLRKLNTRIDALEYKMNSRMNRLEQKMNQQFNLLRDDLQITLKNFAEDMNLDLDTNDATRYPVFQNYRYYANRTYNYNYDCYYGRSQPRRPRGRIGKKKRDNRGRGRGRDRGGGRGGRLGGGSGRRNNYSYLKYYR